MANRSYLYSFNEKKNDKFSKIFDISEQNYEIPIIYKILVSANTKVVPSEIFENGLAIVGDAKQGRENLDLFFKKLHKAKVFEEKELTDLQTMFIEHLNKYTLDYFLFEPIEVIEMNDVDADKEVKNIAKEIANYDKMISNYIKQASADYLNDLGIDFSSYLYFTLGNNDEVERIEKQYNNKKLIKAKELIAKKPSIKHYFTLINELDNKTNAQEINTAIDNILTLNPNFVQLWDCAFYYQDLDKKIALFKQLIIDYPNEEKTKAINFWIANAYEDKKEYDLALKYKIQYIVDKNDPNDDPHLQYIIRDGKFNPQEIYQDLAKKTKNKFIEFILINIDIENKKYDKAFNKYDKIKAFLSDKGITNWREHKIFNYKIAKAFLNANQEEKALKIINDDKLFDLAVNYYSNKDEHSKALYYFIKDKPFDIYGLIYDYSNKGKFANAKIDIKELFRSIYPFLKDFKPKTIIKIARKLLRENLPIISKELLNAVIPFCIEDNDKAKVYFALSKMHKKEGNLEQAKKDIELAFSFNTKLKYKQQYKIYFKEKKYKKAAEIYLKYIQNSNKAIEYYSDVGNKFFDKKLYQEAIPIFKLFLATKGDEDDDKMRDYNTLGLCYLRLSKPDIDKAYINFKKAFESDDNEPVVRRNLYLCATIKFDKNKFNKAKEMFIYCLDNLEYKVAKTNNYLGVIYDRLNENDKALEHFNKALKLKPKNKIYKKNVNYINNKNRGFLDKLFGKKHN